MKPLRIQEGKDSSNIFIIDHRFGRKMALKSVELGAILNNFYQLYSKIIPTYGGIIASDSESYKYLIKSIENFPNQVELSKKMKDAGFKKIEVFDIIDGLASIHIARK